LAVSSPEPKGRTYEITWTNFTYWHRQHRGSPCAFCRVRTEGVARARAPLERAGFKVLHVDSAFVRVDMPDEPFRHPSYGLTTRDALRLRRVIERPAPEPTSRASST
jgi:hypothetical protein